ncbi:MAG TPA: hypothetical protein VHI77_00445 [Solirubrobacterales bacterium]|jgi:hypothetical protein|nr:hypothetical protein [Solirubrobacterales bacterium]
MPQKQLVAILVGVCVLSAAIGSGLALVAQTGPAGPAGKRGPAGPQGPRGPAGKSATAELGRLEAEIEELRSAAEGSAELEERVEDLEGEIGGFEGGGIGRQQLCEEFGIAC